MNHGEMLAGLRRCGGDWRQMLALFVEHQMDGCHLALELLRRHLPEGHFALEVWEPRRWPARIFTDAWRGFPCPRSALHTGWLHGPPNCRSVGGTRHFVDEEGDALAMVGHWKGAPTIRIRINIIFDDGDIYSINVRWLPCVGFGLTKKDHRVMDYVLGVAKVSEIPIWRPPSIVERWILDALDRASFGQLRWDLRVAIPAEGEASDEAGLAILTYMLDVMGTA